MKVCNKIPKLFWELSFYGNWSGFQPLLPAEGVSLFLKAKHWCPIIDIHGVSGFCLFEVLIWYLSDPEISAMNTSDLAIYLVTSNS